MSDLSDNKKILDIDNPKEEFDKLTDRFKLLEKRLQAVAMDYKYYINKDLGDNVIYDMRDSISYRLYSARFHCQLLLEHHHRIEDRLMRLHKNKGAKEFFNSGYDLRMIQIQSIKETYSIFDSMMYHLVSIYDYLFRMINFAHGKTILKNPKWNIFLNKKNRRNFEYCSEEMIDKLEKIDQDFVYPLLGHRSHLIHNEEDTGEFKLDYNLSGENFVASFFATDLFKSNFPDIINGKENCELTIKYSAFWLISKTIETATEVLFELRDEMIKNKKIPHGFAAYIGDDGTIQSPSTPYWGDRNVN
ncbi:MAG: hypothetical protein ACI8ZM_002782 [Crocinitomix sp.]|jgi:hypothetical protein